MSGNLTTDSGWTLRLSAMLAKPEAAQRDINLGGGLRARAGRRSIAFFARIEEPDGNGKTVHRRVTLGHFVPKISASAAGTSAFSVSDARAALLALRGTRANGVDTAVQREKAELASRTLGDAWKGYAADAAQVQKLSTQRYDRLLWTHVQKAKLDKRRASDVKLSDLTRLLRDVKDGVDMKRARATGVVGLRVARLAHRVLRWAAEQGWIDDVCAEPRAPKGLKQEPRSRHLNDAELQTLWTALDAREDEAGPLAGLSLSACRSLRLALLLGMRIGEIVNLRRTDIEFDAGAFGAVHVRAAKTAAGVRTIPLSEPAKELLEKQFKAIPARGSFIFPSVSGSQWSNSAAAHFAGVVSSKLDAPPFGHHDLRRSFITWANLARTDLRALKAVVGHAKDASDITAQYDQSQATMPEKQQVVSLVWRLVSNIVEDSKASTVNNVVPFVA